jgi:hypothetical protein
VSTPRRPVGGAMSLAVMTRNIRKIVNDYVFVKKN